jgi:hypothetical protein
MVSRFEPRKVLSAHDQLARFRVAYPQFRSSVKKGTLVAEGDIRPTARSVAYRVRIEYRADEPPRVYVLSPKLEPREEGGRLPHVYPGDRLCLYLPGAGEWTPDMSLAHTIVPWISEWLFFYETWRVLGVWLGGGVEPAESKTIRKEDKGKPYDGDRN